MGRKFKNQHVSKWGNENNEEYMILAPDGRDNKILFVSLTTRKIISNEVLISYCHDHRELVFYIRHCCFFNLIHY
jgi:hypothetical protein